MPQFFARIQDGVVAEVITLPDGWSLKDTFTPELAEKMKPCTSKTVQGQTLNKNGSYGPVPDAGTEE